MCLVQTKERKERIEKLKQEEMTVGQVKPNSIKIIGLPADLREEAILKEHFNNYGTVSAVEFGGDDAVVTFSNHKEASEAMAEGSKLLKFQLEIVLGESLVSENKNNATPEVEVQFHIHDS